MKLHTEEKEEKKKKRKTQVSGKRVESDTSTEGSVRKFLYARKQSLEEEKEQERKRCSPTTVSQKRCEANRQKGLKIDGMLLQ